MVQRERGTRPHRYQAVSSREEHTVELMHEVLGSAPDREAVLAASSDPSRKVKPRRCGNCSATFSVPCSGPHTCWRSLRYPGMAGADLPFARPVAGEVAVYGDAPLAGDRARRRSVHDRRHADLRPGTARRQPDCGPPRTGRHGALNAPTTALGFWHLLRPPTQPC